MGGWMDCSSGSQNAAIPPIFLGKQVCVGVSAAQHNQGVEVEKEGSQERGVVGTPVPEKGAPGRHTMGVPTPPEVGELSLQATSQGFDAMGFCRRGSRVPPPTELGESPEDQPLLGSPHPAWEDGGRAEEERYHPRSHAAAATRRAVNYNLLAVNKCCVV